MKVISLNTGLPREVTWHGISVSTGIYKEPVEGRVPVRTLNLGGDRQADLTVHGGEQKAVYCYPSEHYGYWKGELPGRELPMAVFGRKLNDGGLAGGLSASWRLLRCRLRGIRCDAAAPALLQTGLKVTARDSNAVCPF